MSPPTTTILFVPGAWHRADCFATVARILEEEGYQTELIDLPSVGPLEHLTSFNPDVDVIREHITKAIAHGQRVAIVAHSYGGIPACEALRDFDHEAKEKIANIFFCASFIIPEGLSLISAFGGQDLPWFKISQDRLEVLPDNPQKIFYNDLPEEKAQDLVKQIKPQSYQVMHSKLSYAAWKHVPCTYLYCSRDMAIPLEVQKMMVNETAGGVDMRTDEIDAGHSPFLSKPREMAESIIKAISVE